jgi:hypothetical protein
MTTAKRTCLLGHLGAPVSVCQQMACGAGYSQSAFVRKWCSRNNPSICISRELLTQWQGETMKHPFQKLAQALLLLALALVVGSNAATTIAQEKKVGQVNGVDNSKMGPYRALAQHIYSDFQKGDVAAAAEMGRVLERVWDKAEDYGGDTALSKTNHALFEEIDKAMDNFLTPLWEAKAKPADPARVKAAYNTYLEKLKLAD